MNRTIAFAVAASSMSLFAASSFGMTAIKNGAVGSAYNNAKSSIDAYNKDPSSSTKACQAAIDPLGITDFQITVEYDSDIFHLADVGETPFAPVQGLNTYYPGHRSAGPGSGIVSVTTNTATGLGQVTIEGFYEGAGPAPSIDQNTIAVTFVYNNAEAVAMSTTLSVVPQPGDYFQGIDPDDLTPVFFDYQHILPSSTGLFGLNSTVSMSNTPHGLGSPPTADLAVPGDGSVAVLDYVYSGRGTRVLAIVGAPSSSGLLQIALHFSEDGENGRAGDIAALILALGLQPVDPAFGPGYDAMFVGTYDSLLQDFNFDDIYSSVRITELAARVIPNAPVPEPTALAALLGVPSLMLRRRR